MLTTMSPIVVVYNIVIARRSDTVEEADGVVTFFPCSLRSHCSY